MFRRTVPSVAPSSRMPGLMINVDAGDPVTRFSDLSEYTEIPAVNSLCLAPDGSWLAAVVQSVGTDSKKYLTSIWRIDTGQAPAVRLTRSAAGEAGPEFLPDGSLLFVSKRPEP